MTLNLSPVVFHLRIEVSASLGWAIFLWAQFFLGILGHVSRIVGIRLPVCFFLVAAHHHLSIFSMPLVWGAWTLPYSPVSKMTNPHLANQHIPRSWLLWLVQRWSYKLSWTSEDLSWNLRVLLWKSECRVIRNHSGDRVLDLSLWIEFYA